MTFNLEAMNKIRVGIDSIDLDYFMGLLDKVPRVLPKLFNAIEIESLTVPRLCGNFAIKEAFFKAYGVGVFSPLTLSVLRDSNGAPRVEIDSRAKKFLKISGISVSLTSNKNQITAIVLLELE